MKNLEKFLLEFNRKAGYGSDNSKAVKRQKDGSTTISYKTGNWQINDNYFGGEPYGGRTIVFYKAKPYWLMVYYGAVAAGYHDFESVYSFLKKALLKKPKGRYHFRGPKKFVEEEFAYTNSWEGDLENYSGKEKITFNGKAIYGARYMGGLVDVRRE